MLLLSDWLSRRKWLTISKKVFDAKKKSDNLALVFSPKLLLNPLVSNGVTTILYRFLFKKISTDLKFANNLHLTDADAFSCILNRSAAAGHIAPVVFDRSYCQNYFHWKRYIMGRNIKLRLFTFGWLHNFLRAVIYAKTLELFASSDIKRLTWQGQPETPVNIIPTTFTCAYWILLETQNGTKFPYIFGVYEVVVQCHL